MRTPHPTPTDHPLPFEQYRGGLVDALGAPAGFPEIALSGPAVARFDELVHDLYADAARVDPERLQKAQRQGLHVSVWTVNEPALMRRLADFGVDSLITDFPGLAKTTLG